MKTRDIVKHVDSTIVIRQFKKFLQICVHRKFFRMYCYRLLGIKKIIIVEILSRNAPRDVNVVLRLFKI